MKLHEALRLLFEKYGGKVLDPDSRFDVAGWLCARQAFDGYPAMEPALRALLSGRCGAELWEYSCCGDAASYLAFAARVKQSLVNPYSVKLIDYTVDSLSYGLGMKSTPADAKDLDMRLQALIASDADSWIREPKYSGPLRFMGALHGGRRSGSSAAASSVLSAAGRTVSRIRSCCLMVILVPLVPALVMALLPDVSFRPGAAGAIAVSAVSAVSERLSGSADEGSGFLGDVMGSVGAMYLSGSLVEKDCGRALEWFTMAAERGDARAAAAAGAMHYYGLGTERDYKEAGSWFRRAAEKGFAPAMTDIGNMYYFGRGEAQDYGEAMKWYRKAAAKGDRAARNNIAAMDMAGQGAADGGEPRPRSGNAVSGSARIIFDVGRSDRPQDDDGADVPQNAEDELRHYRADAEKGDAPAQYYLGTLSENGIMTARNCQEALSWYRKSADQGYAPAEYALGRICAGGRIGERDCGAALQWYQRAADEGFRPAREGPGSVCARGAESGMGPLPLSGGKPEENPGTYAPAPAAEAADSGIAEERAADEGAAPEAPGNADGEQLFRTGSMRYYGTGGMTDYTGALDFFSRAADRGYAPAMTAIGDAYYFGRGAAQDYSEALRWFGKAAEKGDAAAMNNLAAMHFAGLGTARSYGKAAEWFRKAQASSPGVKMIGIMFDVRRPDAEAQTSADELGRADTGASHGDAPAEFYMGMLYEKKIVSLSGAGKAPGYYRAAAERGFAPAAERLGEMYERGELVMRDCALAREWYQKAADMGRDSAREGLQRVSEGCGTPGSGSAPGAGDAAGASPEMSHEEVRRMHEAAVRGDAAAEYRLGMMYDSGTGVPHDPAKAVEWLQKAAEQGHAGAASHLGFLYCTGAAGRADNGLAVKWFRRAADRGSGNGMAFLGRMYLDGRGVTRDPGEAVRWFLKGASKDDVTAEYELGLMYRDGNGVGQDWSEAVKWFRKAAAHGHPDAERNLAEAYRRGLGVAQSSAEAGRWQGLADSHMSGIVRSLRQNGSRPGSAAAEKGER